VAGVDDSGPASAKNPAQPASDYDEMVDWGKRLARELPFFERVLSEAGASRVVDVGCGTGMLAIALARLGLEVTGVDPSESMLAKARVNVEAAGVPVTLVEGGFGDLEQLVSGRVDAVICTGNALPHVEGREGLARALADMASVLRPGGVVILHWLNHDRLAAQRPAMLPAVLRSTTKGPRIFAKVLEYSDDGVEFDFVTVTRGADGAWNAEDRRSLHTWVTTVTAREALAEAGFSDVELYGGHDFRAFDPSADESVIAVARRTEPG
jgi:glycine/sarcosine N-methyltransferase